MLKVRSYTACNFHLCWYGPGSLAEGLEFGWLAGWLQAVVRQQHVITRHAVWKELGVLGGTVFPICAPFIRVRPFLVPQHVNFVIIQGSQVSGVSMCAPRPVRHVEITVAYMAISLADNGYRDLRRLRVQIRASAPGMHDAALDPLDDTRIHPFNYPDASKMAKFCVDKDGACYPPVLECRPCTSEF